MSAAETPEAKFMLIARWARAKRNIHRRNQILIKAAIVVGVGLLVGAAFYFYRVKA
jgi:hypothetical protein